LIAPQLILGRAQDLFGLALVVMTQMLGLWLEDENILIGSVASAVIR
jgi:hypothetical protein